MKMTVKEAMVKFNQTDATTRIYVRELQDEVLHIYNYYDSKVLDIYPHNGDMVCEVENAK